MSKVEFNNYFFVELIEESYVGHTPGWDCLDLWALCWSDPALVVLVWREGCCEPWLLCWDTAGLCSWDHWSSGVGLFNRARAWQGLCGCRGQEPQKGMLVMELTRDAFPLVVRVEVTSLGSRGGLPPPRALAGGAGAAIGSGRAAVFWHCWVLGLHHHHLIIFLCINCPWLTCKDNCAL